MGGADLKFQAMHRAATRFQQAHKAASIQRPLAILEIAPRIPMRIRLAR